jgi:hypothetical protein
LNDKPVLRILQYFFLMTNREIPDRSQRSPGGSDLFCRSSFCDFTGKSRGAAKILEIAFEMMISGCIRRQIRITFAS